MLSFTPRIFLLSPARLDGKRAHLLFHPVTMFPEARALHSTAGAPIGEIFAFLSGLYFRGKLAYAEAFARPPLGLNSGVFVITPNRGLLNPSVRMTVDDLARLAKTEIDPSAKEFRKNPPAGRQSPRADAWPARRAHSAGQHRTRKYIDVLLSTFPQELLFPAVFVGRGDMSPGGLMLSCVDAHMELAYLPIRGAILRGARPPKLPPRSESGLL